MGTLKETAASFVGKRELYDLARISVDIAVQTSSFKNKEGQDVPYNFIEIDGWKYTIKSKIMQQIQQIVLSRPITKFVKVNKAPNGELYVIPLD